MELMPYKPFRIISITVLERQQELWYQHFLCLPVPSFLWTNTALSNMQNMFLKSPVIRTMTQFIRCWKPAPQTDRDRQRDVRCLSFSASKNCVLPSSPKTCGKYGGYTPKTSIAPEYRQTDTGIISSTSENRRLIILPKREVCDRKPELKAKFQGSCFAAVKIRIFI